MLVVSIHMLYTVINHKIIMQKAFIFRRINKC